MLCTGWEATLIPGSSKKATNQLEVWRGELDTPGPPISMLRDSSAWLSLQKKTAILAPAIEKRW